MNTRRYNGFNITHKGLRLMLYETSMLIQQNDFNNTVTTEKLFGHLETVINYFDEHAAHEDEYILPAIEKNEPDLYNRIKSEHVTDHNLAIKIELQIKMWHVAETDDARWLAGRNLMYLFNNFTAFNLEHMNLEETVLNEVLWKYYTDSEIMAMTGRVARSLTEEKILAQNYWSLRNITAPEALAMLQSIHKNSTPQFRNDFFKLAQTSLSEDKWQYVMARLVL